MLLRLPPALKAQVSELARVNKRSLTREVEFALERYVAAPTQAPTGEGCNG